MPGCLSYIVAQDRKDADAIWITEVWNTAASHRASLSLPSVQAAIARGRPLIAGMEAGTETVVVGGGTGWSRARAAHSMPPCLCFMCARAAL